MKLFYQLVLKETREGIGGYSDMWKIIINPKWEHNAGVFAHEYEHLKQWYVMTALGVIGVLALAFFLTPYALVLLPSTFWFRRWVYRWHTPYRKYAEVAAFKKQMALDPTTTDHYERGLASSVYRLNITIPQARRLLYEDR